MEQDGENQVPGRIEQSNERSQNSTETRNADRKITCITSMEHIVTGIRYAIQSFLKPFTRIEIGLTIFMLCIAITKIVTGAIRLESDCPMERDVAVYLFVKSFPALLFWTGILAIGLSGKLIGTIPIDAVAVILRLFSLAWLVVGSVWVSKYSAIIEECPLYVNDWDPRFIRFAIAWICLDWLLILIYLLTGLVCACNANAKTGQSPSNNNQGASQNTAGEITFTTASQHIVNGIRYAIESFLDDYANSTCKKILTVSMMLIAFAKNVAGAVGLRSDCSIEWKVALYLFVKSFFAFLFWIGILAIGLSGKLSDTIQVLIDVVIVILKMFSLAWLIVGSVWVSKYSFIIEECPLYVNDWEPHFIRFAIAWICLDWLLILICLSSPLGLWLKKNW